MPGELFFEDIGVGDALPPVSLTFTPESIAALVKVWTPDRGPSHFISQEMAMLSGFERPIVPDHLSIAYLGNMVLGWADNVRLLKLDAITRRVMFDNDQVTCSGIVVDKGLHRGQTVVHADLQIENARDERPVTASALISVPRRSAQEGAAELPGPPLAELGDDASPPGPAPGDVQGLEVEYNRDILGVDRDLGVVEVTTGMMVAYARAVGAVNPIYWDQEAAKRGPFGGLVALPTFCSILGRGSNGRPVPELNLKFGSRGHQATLAVENYKIIRPGDILRLSSTLQHVYGKTGRSGTLVFAVYQDTLSSPTAEKVATVRYSLVRF